MDDLGPLPKPISDSQYAFLSTDQYTGRTREVPVIKVASNNAAYAVVDHWVFLYGAQKHLLTDNGSSSSLSSSKPLCIHTSPTFEVSRPSSPDQWWYDMFKKTIFSCLRNYVAEHHTGCDLFRKPITFANNAKIYCTTVTTPFSLVLSCQLWVLPPRIRNCRYWPKCRDHASPAHFASAFCEILHAASLYWLRTRKRSIALQALFWQVCSRLSNVSNKSIQICWSPTWTVHHHLMSWARAAFDASPEVRGLVTNSLDHARYYNYRQKQHS